MRENSPMDNSQQPHLKLEKDEDGSSRLLRRTAEGDWEEVKPPAVSADPNVNAMGDLDYEELEAIVQDPEDSRHDLANEYLKLSGDRLREAMKPLTRRLNEQWKDVFKDLTFKPLVEHDLSSFRSPPPPPNTPRDLTSGSDDDGDEGEEGDETTSAQTLGENAADTLTELLHLQQQQFAAFELRASAAAVEATEQQNLLRQQILDAREVAETQKAAAEKDRKHAKKSLCAAWVAVGLTAAVGVVTVVVGIAQIVVGILSLLHA